MSNKNKDTKSTFFNSLYTYFYLPFSVALSLFIALGNYTSFSRIKYASYADYAKFTLLFLPYLVVILNTIALPFMIGKEEKGIRITLFNQTLFLLLILFSLPFILRSTSLFFSLTFILLSFFAIYVYSYYKKYRKENN